MRHLLLFDSLAPPVFIQTSTFDNSMNSFTSPKPLFSVRLLRIMANTYFDVQFNIIFLYLFYLFCGEYRWHQKSRRRWMNTLTEDLILKVVEST